MSNKPTHSSETHRIEFKRELTPELDLEKEGPPGVHCIKIIVASRTRNSIGKIKAHRQAMSFEQLRIYYEERPC
ncbi:MAG: hypothetical protein ACK5A0_05760 [Polaromonas sp.]|jgi:hypothetical protein